MTITSPTAGQRQALGDLGDAARARRPLILLFGETGAGKTSVVHAFLEARACDEVVAVGVSATGSEFVASPGFETLLSSICARLELPAVPDQGPAALAGLGALIRAQAGAGKTVAVAIDHADRLGDGVITELVRLHERLGVPAAAFVRIFVGTAGLAPRIETILRQQGSDERLTEIRLSAPSADEVATILAYEDAARPGGPVLTPDAIGAICAYARSDLHLAAPMADAVRSLCEEQKAGEITPHLVHETLLDLWAPEHAMAGSAAAAEAFPGLRDVATQREAMLAPASLAASDRKGLLRWYGRAKAKFEDRNKPVLALTLAGSSLLLAALVTLALVAGHEGGSRRQAVDDAPRPPSELPAAPAPPAAAPVAPTDPAPASALAETEAEAGPHPSEPQGSPAPVADSSANPDPGEAGHEIIAKPKRTPLAPKPMPKPHEAAKRWVQTR